MRLSAMHELDVAFVKQWHTLKPTALTQRATAAEPRTTIRDIREIRG
jgi:hypothetical protein